MNQSRIRIAQAYEALIAKGHFTDALGGTEKYFGKLTLHYVPETADSILEVGGATGLWMEQVLKQRRALRDVTVVEFSSAANTCRRRLTPLLYGRTNAQLDIKQADFLQIAAQLRPAQVVASSYVAEYMGDTRAYIRQLYDLTEPGGRVIFIDVLSTGMLNAAVILKTFVLTLAAYIRAGVLPALPIWEAISSPAVFSLYQEPAFQSLQDDYHSTYHFPRESWVAVQKEYPGATFHNLGMAGLLVLPKPPL